MFIELSTGLISQTGAWGRLTWRKHNQGEEPEGGNFNCAESWPVQCRRHPGGQFERFIAAVRYLHGTSFVAVRFGFAGIGASTYRTASRLYRRRIRSVLIVFASRELACPSLGINLLKSTLQAKFQRYLSEFTRTIFQARWCFPTIGGFRQPPPNYRESPNPASCVFALLFS
jgi:hypothetical protein